MADPKTKPTDQNPKDFLNTIKPDEKRNDCMEILKIMQEITGEKAIMWGASIIGFGKYHYKSKNSSQEVDWPLAGFSPRKQNITIYAMEGNERNKELLNKLGKHKTSKVCIYIKRLSDVNINILKKLIQNSYDYAKQNS